MLRIQRFTSLWKHYARYKHLNPQDLEYRYKDQVLEDPKESVRSVGVQMDNVIVVGHKKEPRKRPAAET
jgi:hypothetical protein